MILCESPANTVLYSDSSQESEFSVPEAGVEVPFWPGIAIFRPETGVEMPCGLVIAIFRPGSRC